MCTLRARALAATHFATAHTPAVTMSQHQSDMIRGTGKEHAAELAADPNFRDRFYVTNALASFTDSHNRLDILQAPANVARQWGGGGTRCDIESSLYNDGEKQVSLARMLSFPATRAATRAQDPIYPCTAPPSGLP